MRMVRGWDEDGMRRVCVHESKIMKYFLQNAKNSDSNVDLLTDTQAFTNLMILSTRYFSTSSLVKFKFRNFILQRKRGVGDSRAAEKKQVRCHKPGNQETREAGDMKREYAKKKRA